MMTRLATMRCAAFFDSINVFVQEQHGSRHGRITRDAIISPGLVAGMSCEWERARVPKKT